MKHRIHLGKESSILCLLLAMAITLVLSQMAQAASYWWDANGTSAGFGTAGGTWGSSASLTTASQGTLTPGGALTTTSDALNFGTGTATYGLASGSIAVSNTQSISALVFGSQSGSITLSSGGSINFAATGTITVNNTSDIISSTIVGAGTSLTKAGSGALTLNGTSANTFSGLTTVSSGTFNIGKSSVNAIGGNLTINNGGFVGIIGVGDDQIPDTALVTVNNGGTLDVRRSETIGGLTGNGVVQNSNNSLSTILTVGGDNGSSTFSGVMADNQPGTFTYTLGLTKTGTGTFVLSGVNTYKGNTTVSAGTLTVTSAGALYGTGTISVPAGVTVKGGATLRMAGWSYGELGGLQSLSRSSGTIVLGDATTEGIIEYVGTGNANARQANRPLTISAGGAMLKASNSSGTWYVGSATDDDVGNTWTISAGGLLTLSGTGTGSIGGRLPGSGRLTKTGTGTWTLNGVNTYTGGTTINAGTLSISGSGSIGSGALTFAGGAFQIANNLTFANAATISNGQTGTIDVTSGKTGTLSGNFGTTTGALAKTGTGTLTLSGLSAYTGDTTVNGGVLYLTSGSVGGYGTLRSSHVYVSGGATLQLKQESFGYNDIPSLHLDNGSVQFDNYSGDWGLNYIGGITMANGASISLGSGGANAYGDDTARRYQIWSLNSITSYASSQTHTITSAGGYIHAGVTIDVEDGAAATDLSIGVPFGNGTSTPSGLIKTGAGLLELSGTNTYTGSTIINAGTLAITGSINGSGTVTVSGGALTLGGSNKLADGAMVAVSGTGILDMGGNDDTVTTFNMSAGSLNGSGTLTATTYGLSGGTVNANLGAGTATITTGTTTLNGSLGATSANLTSGMLTLGSDNRLADDAAVAISGGTLNLNSKADTIGSRSGNGAVSLGAGTLTTGGSGNTTFSGEISGSGSVTKQGGGTWELTGINTYGGLTTVGAGTLKVNNASGVGIGSGGVTVAGGAYLGGSGTISGLVTLQSGGHLAPGNNIGVLSTGSLTLDIGSFLDFEFNDDGTSHDQINVLNPDGLTLNGGTLNLYADGTTDKWSPPTVGTYKLIKYSGAIQGSGTLSVGNPAVNFIYAVATGTFDGDSYLTVQVDTAVSISEWTGGTSEDWDTAANWAPSGVPGPTGVVNFGTVGANPAVALNTGSAALSAMSFRAAVGTTISGTGSFTLNNNGYGVPVNVAAGNTHTINTGMTVADNSTITANGGLTIGGTITGSGGFGLTKAGTGTVTLSGNNTFDGGATLASGTLVINSAGALGSGTFTIAGGAIDSTAGGVVVNNNAENWTGDFSFGGSQNLSLGAGEIAIGSLQRTVTVSAGGLTVGGNVSGSGSLTKAGNGTLTISSASAYTGGTTLNAGILNIGAETSLGTTAGTLTFNGGTLQFGAAGIALSASRIAMITASGGYVDTSLNDGTIASVIGGNGALTKVGGNTLALTGANVHTGGTRLVGGILSINTGNSLGTFSGGTTGTLTFDGGTLQFGAAGITLSASRRGAITANGGCVDTSLFGGTIASTLSGGGALTKVGGNTLTLTGVNTYTGGTTLNAGVLRINTGNSLGTFSGGTTGTLTFNGGTLQFGAAGITLSALRAGTITAKGGYVDTSIQSGTIASVIGGGGALAKVGGNTLALTGANTYAGGTTISGGTLSISGSGSIGSGALTFNGGAFRIANSLIFANAATITDAQTGTIDVTSGNTGTLSGNIANSSGGLIKTGDGTLTLSGVNAFTGGMTITAGNTAGTVNIQNNQSAATGGWMVGPLNDGTTTLNFQSGSTISVVSGKQIQIGRNNSADPSADSQTLYAAGTVQNDGTLYVGRRGSLIVESGGIWTQNGAMSINAQGGASSSATIRSGATFTYAGVSSIKVNPVTGSATLTIGGKFFTAQGFERTTVPSGGISTVSLTGGLLQLSAPVARLTVNSVAMPFVFSLGAGGGTINTPLGNDGGISGIISGSGSLTKTGTGKLTLTGSAAYSGATTVNQGTLKFIDIVPNSSGSISITSGGTLQFDISTDPGPVSPGESANVAFGAAGGTTMTGDGAFVKSGAGVLALDGQSGGHGVTFNLTGGMIDIQGGTLKNGGWDGGIWTGNKAAMHIAGGATFDLWGGQSVIIDALTGDGTVDMTEEGVWRTRNLTVGINGGSGVFSGVVRNSNGNILGLTKVGAGEQTLAGTNSYGGDTTVSNGVLIASAAGSLGNSTNVTVCGDAGGALALMNDTAIANNAVLHITSGSGKVNVAAGVNATVRALYIDGVLQFQGTWGSSTSPANMRDDAHFSGEGMITVSEGSIVGTIILIR